jgi:Mg-chelatase subunit ChlD
MKTQTNEAFLKAFMQRNKEAREKKAKAETFATAADLILYLKAEIAAGRGAQTYYCPAVKATPPTKPAKSVKGKPVKPVNVISSNGKIPLIHVADVLDSSGSMQGEKYKAAKKGISLGIQSLKESTEQVEYTYTLCDFSDDIIFRQTMAPLITVTEFKLETRGSTALYDAIGDTVAVIKNRLVEGDKVLVNVYTDGQENSSRRYRKEQIAELIETLSSQGWTFTFIGTVGDVAYAQNNLKFHASNTLTHDNSGQGMEKAFTANNVARASYSAKVYKGEDVSTGFYKDIE